MPKKSTLLAVSLLALAFTTFFLVNRNSEPESIPTPIVEDIPAATLTPARKPQLIPIEDGLLKDAVIAAGDYMVRQQLANGELSYQVNFLNHDRSYTPSDIRLVAGTGSLYTVCRVSGDVKYCEAGDLALDHYLEMLVSDSETFKGTCLYTNGGCPLGGAALTVDAIYKRWQATGGFFMDDHNLLDTAMDLGYFIVSMRKPGGGFYHSFDPHFAGSVDPNYFVINFPGESLYALLQLYEMTGNSFWLEQAREVNRFMVTQPVTEDHWHSYAFAMFARLDSLSRADQAYADQIADTIIAGQVRSLNPVNTSISTATKVESLSALAQALFLSGAEHERLDRDIRTFITFVLARQLPDDNCNFDITDDMILRYEGGVFSACEDPSIRVDGVQHWINGVTAYLEYQSMMEAK
ncbi:MAG: hypothetical protein Q8L87_16005 [Anaerolineales bacterium]|jgi:hypothetical protein|nr:hypothetical protein [Anaerolineales bacterium]